MLFYVPLTNIGAGKTGKQEQNAAYHTCMCYTSVKQSVSLNDSVQYVFGDDGPPDCHYSFQIKNQ